jgi:hypothetical protein
MWFDPLVIFDNLTRERRDDAKTPAGARMT